MVKYNGWEETISSVLILAVHFSLIGLSNTIMVVYFLSSIIDPFSSPSTLQFIELATHQTFCFPEVRNKISLASTTLPTSLPHFTFYCKAKKSNTPVFENASK